MVHSAVLSFTCGSLREVCMEARAVTAGLPALTGGGGCRRSSAIRVVHLPWRGFSVGSIAQGAGTMGFSDLSWAHSCSDDLSYQSFSNSRLESICGRKVNGSREVGG